MYYLAITETDGDDIRTDSIGPFDTVVEAESFIKHHPRAHVYPNDHPHWPGYVVISPLNGGYCYAHIIGPDTVASPEDVLREWRDG